MTERNETIYGTCTCGAESLDYCECEICGYCETYMNECMCGHCGYCYERDENCECD